jgi:hypothetical protein
VSSDNASAICFETLLQSRQKSSSHIPHVTARLLSDIVASHFGHDLLPTLCLFSSLLGNGVELIKFDAIFFSFYSAFEILASIIQTGLPCFGFINKLPCLLKVST